LFRIVPRILLLIAAVQLLGGHWAVLQTVAWTSMLIENAKTETLPDALQKTFSGKNPCALCHVVKDGVDEEKKQNENKTLLKLEAVLAGLVELPRPSVAKWLHPMPAAPLTSRSSAPPTPPPWA